MKKMLVTLWLVILISCTSHIFSKVIAANVAEDLNKTFITLEEAEELGTYKKIEKIPDGMFEISMSSKARAKESMMKMYDVFVRNKGLMQKYPERLMRAMGYFELFYMDQLDEKRDEIKRFKKNYPNISKGLKKKMQSLYSLNQAKKSMREAMGLTLNDNPEVALERYMMMHNFLEQGEKSINKLSKDEKRLKKKSANFKKRYGSFKKNIELRSENRIDQKTFDKELKKNIKDVKKTLGKLTSSGSKGEELYTTVATIFEKSLEFLDNCSPSCGRKDLLTAIDSVDFTKAIIADAEKVLITKQYTQDMSKFDIETLSNQQKEVLAAVSTSTQNQKSISKNDLQNSVLNLENHNFPAGEYLNKIEEQGFEISSINMSFGKIEEMNGWEKEDWAQSWRGKLPSEIEDSNGNFIEFSEKNMDDIKAQLALHTFNGMIDASALETESSINENVKEIVEAIASSGGFNLDSWSKQDYSVTLDSYSVIIGNAAGVNINNFSDLTNYFNSAYNTSTTEADYRLFYQGKTQYGSEISDVVKGVDLINQVGSFDAMQIAASIGTDLQTVADTIAEAAAVGVSTDLEAAAAGLGYDSFADAVSAYNAQYGTNYTTESAKEALGQ
jgi:hypothetical protein